MHQYLCLPGNGQTTSLGGSYSNNIRKWRAGPFVFIDPTLLTLSPWQQMALLPAKNPELVLGACRRTDQDLVQVNRQHLKKRKKGEAIGPASVRQCSFMTAVSSVKAHQKPPGQTLVSTMQTNVHARAHTLSYQRHTLLHSHFHPHVPWLVLGSWLVTRDLSDSIPIIFKPSNQNPDYKTQSSGTHTHIQHAMQAEITPHR